VSAVPKDPAQKNDRDHADIIIALDMAKKGFDWIWCDPVRARRCPSRCPAQDLHNRRRYGTITGYLYDHKTAALVRSRTAIK
jgi:hypothetical protein